MASKRHIVICLAVFFGALSSTILGIDMAFNVYAVGVKESFNFTQYQVEIVASTGTVGMGLVFLETIVTGTCGYLVTYLVTWSVIPLSSGLMSLTAVYGHYFHHRPMAIYIFHLMFSTGVSMAGTVIGRVLLEILPPEHTGKLVGLVYAVNCLGKVVYAAEVSLFFQHSLAGFFLTSAVTFALVLGICYPLLHLASKPASKPEYLVINKGASTTPEQEQPHNSFRYLLSSSYFHATFWPSVVVYACSYTCMNNITYIAMSAGIENSILTVYLVSVVIILTRLGTGFAFDRFQSENCGFFLIITSFLCFGIGAALGMLSDDVYVIVLVTILVGIGNGPTGALSISLLVRRFGCKHYSHISALFFGVLAVSQSLIQCFSGYLYDIEIERDGKEGIFCYGKACFYWSFFTMLVLTLLSTVVQIINWRITIHNKSDTF